MLPLHVVSIMEAIFVKDFPELSAKTSTYADTETVRKVQNALNEAGYNRGTADGVAGSATYSALSAYQEARASSGKSDHK